MAKGMVKESEENEIDPTMEEEGAWQAELPPT